MIPRRMAQLRYKISVDTSFTGLFSMETGLEMFETAMTEFGLRAGWLHHLHRSGVARLENQLPPGNRKMNLSFLGGALPRHPGPGAYGVRRRHRCHVGVGKWRRRLLGGPASAHGHLLHLRNGRRVCRSQGI